MHRPVFMTGSWRKSQETKSPPWRKETYGLPAWQMLVLVISPLCTLFMWWVTTRHALFSPTHTPLLHPHRCIFMWMNVWLLCKHWLAGQSQNELLNLEDSSSVPKVPIPGESTVLSAFRRNSAHHSLLFFLLHSLPNWPNLDQRWLNEHHYACVHESVESADLRLSVLADAKGRSLEASKRKLPC